MKRGKKKKGLWTEENKEMLKKEKINSEGTYEKEI